MSIYESARVLKFRDGSKKPYEELIAGDQQSADSVRVHVRSRFAFEADWREETVTGPDGRIIHRTAHRLSEHAGHGSDKPALKVARAEAKELRTAQRVARKAERDGLHRRGELAAYLERRRADA